MERVDLFTVVQKAIKNELLKTHTALIAKVIAVNDYTIDVKPVRKFKSNDTEYDAPIFKDVPLLIMQGGDSYIQMPIAVDDNVQLLVNERDFDNWWAGVDDKVPMTIRHHDLSDSVAIMGINNNLKKIKIPKDFIQIKGNSKQDGNRELLGDEKIDGDIEHKGDSYTSEYTDVTLKHTNMNIESDSVDIQANSLSIKANNDVSIESFNSTIKATNLTLEAQNIDLKGNVNITGVLTINGTPYVAHTHSNGNMGSPTGGVIV